ncbi:hypothetical protein NE865_10568 [Phthorimaea operculella]|nr:hypothetical protein NE865_10568 [Phthorimaea operculella]
MAGVCAKVCAGCTLEIPDRYYLTCSNPNCKDHYDLVCANVPELRFNNTMKDEHKKAWKCPLCIAKIRKIDYINTPIRNHTNPPGENNQQYCETPYGQNVTMRVQGRGRGPNVVSPADESVCSQNGNTLLLDESLPFENQPQFLHPSEIPETNTPITLHQINQLIQKNLQHNTEFMLSSLKSTFQSEIENAVATLKSDFQKNKEYLQKENTKLKADIHKLDSKIILLQNQCSTLQEEYKKIQKKLDTENTDSNPATATIQNATNQNANEKTFVLHGLTYNYWETEEDLINRVTNVIYDVLNINISNDIDEITFIGKKGYKRPIKIEIISKRLKKYILENSVYFKEAGLSVSDYLNEKDLRERRELQKALKSARENGHHAVIRNNKLLINGRESLIIINENHNRTDAGISESEINGAESQRNSEEANDNFRN